jgi:O-antigen ligase
MYNPGWSNIEQSGPTGWVRKAREQWGQRINPANLVGLLGAIITLFCLLVLPQLQYWNFRVTLYLIVTIWTIIRPRIALYLLLLTIPWGSLDVIGSNITSTDILVALLAGSWLLGYTLRPFIAPGIRNGGPLDREDFNVPRPLAFSMLFLLLTMLISFIGTTNLSDSLKEIMKWSEALVILLLGTQYIRTRRHVWTMVVILCLAGLSQALVGYAQVFLDLGPVSFVRDASLRVYGTFGQPNPYAGYINMTLALALALFLLGQGWKTRLLAGSIALPLMGVEIYSQSKGGWMALAVAAIFIVIVGFPRLRVLARVGLVGIIGAVAVYLAGKFPLGLIEPILMKMGIIDISLTAPTDLNYANSERVAHWLAGINMFQAHPLFGVGIGNYQDVYSQYQVGIFVLPLGHAHNYYINIAAEAGIFGLSAFILFLTVVFIYSRRSYQSIHQRYQQLIKHLNNPQPSTTSAETHSLFRRLTIATNDRALAIGLIASLITVCIHNLVDNLYVHAMVNLFALLIVLLIRLDSF